MTLAALLLLNSCAFMTEEEPDCNPYYKVRFRFDRNMLYADAFSSQVGEVDLYVFDTDGKLVWKGHDEGEALAREGYMMDLPVEPGTYDFVAWCHNRHEKAAGFSLNEGNDPTHISHLKMKMDRKYDAAQAHSTTDLHALFHGKLTACELPDTWGTHIITIPLTKDTNSIKIQLVHLSGKDIDVKDFDIKITDNNGYLDHDNSFLDDEHIEYRPWAVDNGNVSMVLPTPSAEDDGSNAPLFSKSRSATNAQTIFAQFTTSRLQTSRNPKITIIRKSDGRKVVNVPVNDFFLAVKGYYNRPMDDDEYLDRQDDYNLTFFMNDDGTWYSSVIDVLSWRIAWQSADL